MPNYCYGHFGHTPSTPRPGEHAAIRNLSRMDAPVASAESVLPTSMLAPPDSIRHLYRYNGPLYRLIEAVRSLCSSNRRAAIATYRSHETISWIRCSSALGRMLATLGRQSEGGPMPPSSQSRPPGFEHRCEQLQQALAHNQHLLDPLPQTNPGLHQEVMRDARAVRDLLMNNELAGELRQMRESEGITPWSAAALLRVKDLVVLAMGEVEQTHLQGEFADQLDNVIRVGGQNGIEAIAGLVENTSAGLEFMGHVIGITARYKLMQLARNPASAGGTADAYINRWARMLDDVDAAQIRSALRTGERARVDGVREELRGKGFSDATRLGRLTSSLGFVQALYVLGNSAAGGNAQSGLTGVQDLLSTGSAFTTVSGATFALLTNSGTRMMSPVGLSRLFSATSEVVGALGSGLSLAGAAFAIVGGLHTISVGWRGGANVDTRTVASGALQVSGGVLLIVGVLAASPGLQAAAVLVGLVALGIELTRPDEPYCKQLMQSLLESIHRRNDIATRLGVATQVVELLEYTRGVDAQGQGSSEPWEYWTPNEADLGNPGGNDTRHAIAEGWRALLRDAGFGPDMVGRLLPASSR